MQSGFLPDDADKPCAVSGGSRVGKCVAAGGPKWECNFGQFEEGDWKEFIHVGGDFDALGADLITDAPVEGFAVFWRDTCPPPEAPAPDGPALHAPLRFMS